MARPDEFPVVANTDTTLPAAGTDNKIQPTPTIQETGWDLGQQPAAQHFNWLFHKIYKWIEYFDSIMGTNFAKASKAEAESGVNDEKWMSPLKTKQHVDARIPADAAAAQDDTDSESLMTPQSTQWVFDKYGISPDFLTVLSPSGGTVDIDSVSERGDYFVNGNSTDGVVTTAPSALPNSADQKAILKVRRHVNRATQEFIVLDYDDNSLAGYRFVRYSENAQLNPPSWSDWKSEADVEASATGNQNLSPTGFQRLPGGMIIQWGQVTLNGDTEITFPTPFPNACVNAHVTRNQSRTFQYGNETYAWNVTNTSMMVAISHQNAAVSGPVFWMAIGY